MTDTTSLGDRIKAYESVYETNLMRRVPIIIRCDGKAFSALTRNLEKPFDESFSHIMAETMFWVAKEIDGCVYGYTQSDEITFVVRNDRTLNTEPWFGNRLQKICSVVSSLVTGHFNNIKGAVGWPRTAFFDARVFTVPNLVEAANVLVWRQNDCVKNSISCACYHEVAREVGKKTARGMMHTLNQSQQQELLFQKTGINWSTYPPRFKNGRGCYKIQGQDRLEWHLESNIPRWTAEGEFQFLLDKLNMGYSNGNE
jgi:tRNA(His) guanylyltransferase